MTDRRGEIENKINKSVSECFMEASLKFNAYALSGFAWLSAECYKQINIQNKNDDPRKE